MPILFASSFRREIRQLSKAQKCKKQRGKLVCRIYTLDAPLLPSFYFSRFVIGSVWPQGEEEEEEEEESVRHEKSSFFPPAAITSMCTKGSIWTHSGFPAKSAKWAKGEKTLSSSSSFVLTPSRIWREP